MKPKSKKSKTLDETLRSAIDYDSESSLSPSQKLLKLIAPFPKDHLITLLSTFAITNSTLLDQIRIAADVNVCHRRLFVYGIEGAVSEEDLRRVFGEYGELEDCHVVVDRETRAKKGYGFVRFRERRAAALALRERVKSVGNGRVVQCVLAGAGVGRGGGGGGVAAEVGTRKIYVSHVSKDADPLKLSAFFRKFGDIEEGPLGFDYKTGKSRGFAIFVYRTVEGARKALEEPLKIFEGHQLYCKKHEEVKKDTVVPTAPAGAPQQMLPPKTQEASSSFPQSMLPKTVQDVSPQTVQAQASPLVSAPGLPPGTGQAAPQQAMHGLSHVYPVPSHVVHPPVPSHAAHPPPQLLAAVAAAQNLAMYNRNPGLSTYYGGMLGAPSNSPYFPGRVDGMVGGSYGASQPYGNCVGYGDSSFTDVIDPITCSSRLIFATHHDNQDSMVVAGKSVVTDLMKEGKLDERNYDLWHRKIQLLLEDLEVLEPIILTMDPPELGNSAQHRREQEAYQEWRKKDRKARLTLLATMRNDIMLHFERHNTAKRVWDAVKLQYGGTSTTRLRHLTLKFEGYKKRSDHSMRQHLTTMINMIGELGAAGHALTDEQQVQAVIRSLPRSWEHMRVYLTHNELIRTFDDVSRHLEMEEDRLIDDKTTSEAHMASISQRRVSGSRRKRGREDDSMNQRPAKRTAGRVCFKCRKTGHFARDCTEQKEPRNI